MEIDVRSGQATAVSSIRFHDVASIKEMGSNLTVVSNTGDVLVTIPKVTIDAFILALQRSKVIFP